MAVTSPVAGAGPAAAVVAAMVAGTVETAECSPPHVKRSAPRSPSALLAGRLDMLQCAPFDGGCPSDSPSLVPSQKRPRAPPSPTLRLPALVDMPRYEAGTGGSSGSGSSRWPYEPQGQTCNSLEQVSGGSLNGDRHAPNDWRMVLYHDRNVVLYNPGETPPFRSRRLTMDEATTSELTNAFGRCPLCRQTIDARFAFAAQAYFDLLQGLFRSSSSREAHDHADEVDLLAEADLYRILGVPRNAKPDDIKRAYRKRSLRYHPDKNLDDSDAKLKFQKVAEAFSVLSDENKRAKYDKSGDMDLEDFDVETFMDMVHSSGLKYQKPVDSTEVEEIDAERVGEMLEVPHDGANPFIMETPPEEVPVMASEGGKEAEAAAAAALRHLPPGLLNTGYYARFFIETRALGSGSFGAVYLCRHVLDDLTLGDYAVKKVPVGDNKAWLRDMIREVKTFERLHHPNVVEYKHSWLELSRRSPFCPLVPFLFILMQYCNGGSLDELIWHDGNPLRPRAPLPVPQIWHLLLDILMGLQHLHRQGILHRDLKPTNILLTWPDEPAGSRGASNHGSGTPRALLSDFGTAAPFGEPPASSTVSRGYTGTVEYTAPELLLPGDDREYTEKSDMWSLGIVLYALCFSALPFSHDDPHVLKGIIRGFIEERRTLLARHVAAGGSPDEAAEWLPPDCGGRLGPLRLVMSALLAFDAEKRPGTTDLLENPVFRGQALRHSRRSNDGNHHAALPFG